MRTLSDADADRHAAGIADGFDRRLQRLCGYGTYRGLIGHTDKTDPITLLDEDEPHSMIWDAS